MLNGLLQSAQSAIYNYHTASRSYNVAVADEILEKAIPDQERRDGFKAHFLLDKSIRAKQLTQIIDQAGIENITTTKPAFHLINFLSKRTAFDDSFSQKHMRNLIDAVHNNLENVEKDDAMKVMIFSLAQALSHIDEAKRSQIREVLNSGIDYSMYKFVENHVEERARKHLNGLLNEIINDDTLHLDPELYHELAQIVVKTKSSDSFDKTLREAASLKEPGTENLNTALDPSFHFITRHFIENQIKERTIHGKLLKLLSSSAEDFIKANYNATPPLNKRADIFKQAIQGYGDENINLDFAYNLHSPNLSSQKALGKNLPRVFANLQAQGYQDFVINYNANGLGIEQLRKAILANTDIENDESLRSKLNEFFEIKNKETDFYKFNDFNETEVTEINKDPESKFNLAILNSIKAYSLKNSKLSFKFYNKDDAQRHYENKVVFVDFEGSPLPGAFEYKLANIAFNPFDRDPINLEALYDDVKPEDDDAMSAEAFLPWIAKQILVNTKSRIEDGFNFSFKDTNALLEKMIDRAGEEGYNLINELGKTDFLDLSFFSQYKGRGGDGPGDGSSNPGPQVPWGVAA